MHMRAGGIPCWEHTLITLLSDHIWPHLSAPSKQRLRLTSRSLKAAVDSNVECVELTSYNDVWPLRHMKRWKPRRLVVHSEALGQFWDTAMWVATPGVQSINGPWTERLDTLILREVRIPKTTTQVGVAAADAGDEST
jgi:hypothetical protein